MTEKLTDEERQWLLTLLPQTGAKALRCIDAHESDRSALVEQAAYYHRKAEALAAVIERRTELLRAASLAMPAPWPLPRETGLAIQEALATAPEHTAPDPKRRPGMTKRDLGILLDTMGGELAAANARLEPTVRALNTERAARIDITEKLAAAEARVAELEREASEWKANWENATTLVEQHRKAALSEAGHAIQSEDALAAANARVAELEARKAHVESVWVEKFNSANARAEAAELALTQECRLALSESNRARDAESEAATLRARVAELEGRLEKEQERATANADMYASANARAEAAELDQASWRRTAEKLESEAAQLKARLEAAEQEQELKQAHIDTKATAERWQRAESEAAALRAELAVRSQQYDTAFRERAEAEAQAAALRAEVKRQKELLDMCSANFDRMVEERQRADAAESQLAAANALLRDVEVGMMGKSPFRSRIQDHLAACSGQAPARSDHERAVLEAMAGIPVQNLRALLRGGQCALKGLPEAASAELARREAEK